MKFLVDRCAGQRVAVWLKAQGYEVQAAWEIGPDPGDAALLQHAAMEGRVLITIDTDFGTLVYEKAAAHAGLIRLPDVPADERIRLLAQVLSMHSKDLESHAIITVRGERIRVALPPAGR